MRLLVKWEFRQAFVSVSHTVGFYVGLCHNVEPVLVAQLVPENVVRIVTSTYCVDIQLFHSEYILDHTLSGSIISTVRVHLVAVGSLEKYRLSVHKYLGILELYFHESCLNRDHLLGAAC